MSCLVKTDLWYASCTGKWPKKHAQKEPKVLESHAVQSNWDMSQCQSFRLSPFIPPSYRHSHRILITSLVGILSIYIYTSRVQSSCNSGLRFQPLQWQIITARGCESLIKSIKSIYSTHLVSISPTNQPTNLVGGIPTPLKNDGVRQLGFRNSQLNGKS